MRISVQIEFDKILDLNTNKQSVIVGRADDVADLVIPHNSVSRKHCKIEFEEKIFYITDLQSSNGVYLNGNKIQPMVKTRIPPKASLRIAKLDCELSDKVANVPAEKIESHQNNHDFTSTIRIARIDLEKDILETREVTKSPPKVKGPRNPITYLDPEKKKTKVDKVNYLMWVGFIIVAFVGFIVYRSVK